jgi:hypothetical protein
MDNHEQSESRRWVAASAELLAASPDWEPDLRLARVRFAVRSDARVQRRLHTRRRLLAGAAAAIAVAVAVPAIPQTHALAQQAANSTWQRLEQAWYWLTVVRRGPVLMGRFPQAVEALHIRQIGRPAAAADAGFTPRLPPAGALTAAPLLSTQGPMSFEADASTGERLTLEVGVTVTARWADVSDGRETWSELTLAQGRAKVTAPPGFDRTAFAAATLRAAGMRNPDAVRQLAGQPTTLPALLSGYRSSHQFLGVRDVPLRGGVVTMVEEGESSGGDVHVSRLTMLWSAEDRMYALSGIPKTPTGIVGGDLAVAMSGAISVIYATAPPTGGRPPHRTLYRVSPDNR